MLTSKGLAWASASLALTALGLAFSATPLVLSGVALGLHAALAWAMLGRPHLSGDLELERREVTEKNKLGFEATVENHARRPLVARYRVDLPRPFRDLDDAAVGSLLLLPEDDHVIEGRLEPQLHGPYDVGPATLLLEDPAGLVDREVELGSASSLLAYPQIQDAREQPLNSKQVTPYIGMHEVQQPGEGFEFYALRQYEQGDSIRSINWRASARSDDMIVNQRVKESYATVTVLADGRAWEGLGVFEHAPWFRNARAAAALANAFMKGSDRVTFHLATDGLDTIKPGPSARQRKKILDLLAGTRPHGNVPLSEKIDGMLAQLRPRSLFVLVSSLENEPGLADAIKQLRVREIQVLVITPGTVWPEDAPELEALKRRRQNALEKARTAGAQVIEWEPNQLLSVTLREVAHA